MPRDLEFFMDEAVDYVLPGEDNPEQNTNEKPEAEAVPAWGDSQPISSELRSVDPLPFEALPDSFRPWIEDVAHRMQCPPDFIAMSALTLTASIIGTRCGIHPKKNDDWLVIPNLWGGVVGAPSTLKTPAISEALKPLIRLEAEAKKKANEDERKYQADLIELQAKKDSLKNDMRKAAAGKGEKSTESVKADLIELEEPEKPPMVRHKTNDPTIEKLSELCNENPKGLLIFRDELIGLLSGWDKPGRESDRAFFLESWNGDGSHTSDRIGRGTIFTEHLCLSVFGGIQPQKLAAYLHQSMNGLENDGLIQRFQLLVYPNEIKDWKLIDQAPDQEARDRAYCVIDRLAHMDFKKYGAIQGEHDRFAYLRFSDEAQEVFYEWITDLEVNKLRASDHPIILEHLGKYRSLMPSLALAFHLISIADGGPKGPVSYLSAQKAAVLCKYLESHARRIYGTVLNIGQQAASILAEKIKDGTLKDGFTARDVYRKQWHLLNGKELVQSACDELVSLGWLRRLITPPAFQQKEKIEYVINPKIISEYA
jgi:hypothetical protein